MKKFDNYTYYSDGKGSVYAVSTYAGKTIRGKATCSEVDSFNEAAGKKLAALRCNAKVADKRYRNAVQKFNAAQEAYDKAVRELERMESYYVDAFRKLTEADNQLDEYLKELV